MKLAWYNFIPQWVAHVFYLALFLIPLGGIVWMFRNFEYPQLFEGQPYAALLYKMTLTLPLIAISSYGVISLVVNQRLYEEYNHKQRVIQLYHSFKKEIEASSDEELKIKLLNIMLDVVRDKPSAKMTRHEKTILDSLSQQMGKVVEKIGGNGG